MMQQIVQRLFLEMKKKSVAAGFGDLKDLWISVLEIRVCAFEEIYLFL